MADRAFYTLRLRGWPDREGASFARRAVALLFLNLLDGTFTLAFLHLGIAEEANPIMRLAYDASPLAFMVVKLAAVYLGVLLLWSHRSSPLSRLCLGLGAWLYAAIVAWHFTFLAGLLAR